MWNSRISKALYKYGIFLVWMMVSRFHFLIFLRLDFLDDGLDFILVSAIFVFVEDFEGAIQIPIFFAALFSVGLPIAVLGAGGANFPIFVIVVPLAPSHADFCFASSSLCVVQYAAISRNFLNSASRSSLLSIPLRSFSSCTAIFSSRILAGFLLPVSQAV